ncbi:MAG: hypothetical protein IKM11_00900, partial [Oscillospiraceae bacterium]|nr:hypothetical protein [Oscillospiraceae bacterium]
SHNSIALFTDRHPLEENTLHLPRSPATLCSLPHCTFALGCLVRFCAAPKLAVRSVSGND